MVHLTRIYTKTGDAGTTSLGDMSRTSKNDPRIEAYATVDEANSQLGMVLAFGGDFIAKYETLLLRIQNDLFDVGADLATPVIDNPKYEPLRITVEAISFLEQQIDAINADLKPLNSFVLPSGSKEAALLHVARTVVRRAERATWAAIHAFGDGVSVLTAQYLNRLSDLLFVMARAANNGVENLWVPAANRGGKK
jgi:cob(I)alamin adenosyltransferase